MEHITSFDGVRIAYERSGTGPHLILVHGGLASDHTRWDRLVEHLNDSFTIYAMDRRGRGGSGDGDEYSFDIEVDDVVALAQSIDGPVNLYGVSLGAIFALEAAVRVRNLSRLALYEPSLPAEEASSIPDHIKKKVQSLLQEGNSEEALVTVMQDIVGMSLQEIEHLRQTPTWPARVAAAHTYLREEEALDNYQFDPDRFRTLRVPTLLLKGSESPQFLQDSVDIVHDILPDSDLHVLRGQGHLADITAPEMVATALREFLLAE